MLNFDLPKNKSSMIKVIGVGGGGNNAVNHMFREGIKDVDFINCNTDAQVLEASPVPGIIQLGDGGRGAGAKPSVGKEAAEEAREQLIEVLSVNTEMVFITAGMGGGTGTGAAPVVASIAKELGILTVGIVTYPFKWEGKRRIKQAEEGLAELRKYVDTLLVIDNNKIREIYGNLSCSLAFGHADNILTTAARSIAEIITVRGYINVDFEDVKEVMANSGTAILGTGRASGENRSIEAVEEALTSPLLNDADIYGADNVLIYISSGLGENQISMDEIDDIMMYVQERAGEDADLIWGNGQDEVLEGEVNISIIATGFEKKEKEQKREEEENTKGKRFTLNGEPVAEEPKREPHISDEEPSLRRNTMLPTESGITLKTVENRDATANTSAEYVDPTVVAEHEEEMIKPDFIDLRKVEMPPSESFYDKEKHERDTHERVSKLRSHSQMVGYRTTLDLQELENRPAYERQNVQIDNRTISSESVGNRYNLNGDMVSPNSFFTQTKD